MMRVMLRVSELSEPVEEGSGLVHIALARYEGFLHQLAWESHAYQLLHLHSPTT